MQRAKARNFQAEETENEENSSPKNARNVHETKKQIEDN